MTEIEGDQWPEEELVEVGDYAFSPPYIPTTEQIEQAEMFIFSHPAFVGIEEEQRRRNVIRLALDSAMAEHTLDQEDVQNVSIIPLIGDVVVISTSRRHEGTVVSNYEIHQGEK